MIKNIFCIPLLFIFFAGSVHKSFAQQKETHILPGAERMSVYLPLLKNKRVAIFANNTSTVNGVNLVDTLVKSGVDIRIIYGPEHGFRGTADAGETVANGKDPATGITVISLYGKKTKPSVEELNSVDLLLFDIQDVGCRFYTYISSLQDYLEAAIEHHKPLLILDRPNPNGFYIDGPVLDPKFKSFVGMQPIPIVYGMTIGEYALMIAGEKWLSPEANRTEEYNVKTNPTADTPFHVLVIKCAGYTHKSHYRLPVKPSPNLPEMQSVYWYPSTCLFEGTALSEGRGTPKPFQWFGHPDLPKNLFSFTPQSTPGAANPKLKDKLCYGWNLNDTEEKVLDAVHGCIQLKYLLIAYAAFPKKDSFFLSNGGYFNKLAGNDVLISQVKKGMTEAQIRESWQPELTRFKAIRKKYLLYAD